ncbi:GFA family protein [Chelativorans xinjiangense]|uniref:GFA family protein n=1 Tax=Chelativorans xinjiangense TaxID=2681485 RepID=UPI0013583B62|nr:GFA family protein [Chelativorans xinjiangense]
MSRLREGGCLCGAVRFRTHGSLRCVVYCHCSQCRKQSGHIYAATDVDNARLEIAGAGNLAWYAASDFARRGFCKTCGSVLFWKRNGADVTSIMAGSFERPSGLKAEAHIFVADKGDYYEITDGLPQYARSSDSILVADEPQKPQK